ncbi:polysaccharide deacetylase family protein, partial [Candidatus Parcubacteria bacterium]|nr:polysaccharide deacetylase family protein [Candidatus Parcubacteria bacterium]
STAPTTNLCNKGTASAVTGTGPWAWTCAGLNGGTTASCSANKTVADSIAPVISITSPTNFSTVSGIITISADATDNVGVVGVKFFVDGVQLGSEDMTAPYSTTLDTKTLANGSHTILARARDAVGNNAAREITVTVNNTTVTPVNGECGSADGSTVSTAPTTNLCNKGTASAVTGTGPWAWTCAGLNGGTTASCSANKTVVTDNLIQNPSFEESDASSNPVGWFTGGWGTNTPVFTYPVAGYNSAKAAKVQITSYTDGDAKWYFNDVSVLANQEYKISLNYQSNTTGYLTVRYTLSDATVQYADIGTLTPSAGWASVEKTFTTPANTVSVTVFSLINSVGYLTVDNFYLSKTTITPISQGQVSLNFDDGWLSVYNNALPILNAAGYKSTQYIISNQIGAASYVTASQILAMQATGHEIGAHSQTHADLTTLSGTQLQNEIVGSKQDLLNIGVTQVLTYAYPYGSTNSTIISSIQSTGFIGARGVEGGYNDKTSNKYILNSYSIESSTTINTIKNWIDTAVANNTWVILVFHRVDTSGEQYSVTPQMLQQIVDYLKLKNVSVVTNAQGLQSLSE